MHHGTISKPIADGLLERRRRIEKGGIPFSKLDETLNLATWNIREFGKKAHSEAAIHYIAEILGQLDLIGIVELRFNFAGSEIGRPQAGPERSRGASPRDGANTTSPTSKRSCASSAPTGASCTRT